MENGKKSKIRDASEAAGRRRRVRASNSRSETGRVDLEALLAGHRRQAVTLLPRGVLGVATAIEFLGALPRACRLGLPDVTDSGPKLFALLVAHGVLAAMPSPRVVPAALALVSGVSPLLQARSARQWTLWLGQVREPSSAMIGALREQTPMSQISLAPPSTTAHPLRVADEKIAALQAKFGDRRRDQLEAHAQVEALEIELSEANAELDLRRSRMLRPEPRDVEQYRAAGAADARRAQQRRKTSSRL